MNGFVLNLDGGWLSLPMELIYFTTFALHSVVGVSHVWLHYKQVPTPTWERSIRQSQVFLPTWPSSQYQPPSHKGHCTCHAIELPSLTPSWCTSSPISIMAFWTPKPIAFHRRKIHIHGWNYFLLASRSEWQCDNLTLKRSKIKMNTANLFFFFFLFFLINFPGINQ